MTPGCVGGFAMSCLNAYPDQRRVLLIDSDVVRQKMRASALRNFDVEVHTTGSTHEAEFLCAVNTYDLVLLAGEHDPSLFSEEVRKLRPQQRVAALVGAPMFVQEIGGVVVPIRSSMPR